MSIIQYEKLDHDLFFEKENNSVLAYDGYSGVVFNINDNSHIIPKFVVGNSICCERPFVQPIYNDSVIYFLPYEYDRLGIYNINTKEWEEIDIGLNSEYKGDNKGYFLNGIVHGNKLILFPFSYPDIIIFDINDYSCATVSIKNIYEKNNKTLFIKYCMGNEDEILLPVLGDKSVVRFNVEKLTYDVIVLQDGISCNSIIKYNHKFYILEKNRLRIDILDENFHFINDVIICEKVTNTSLTYFDQSGFEVYEDYIYCFPARWDHVVRIRISDLSFELLDVFNKYCQTDDSDRSKFNHAIRVNNVLYIQNCNKMVLAFNMETGEISEISSEFVDADYMILNRFIKDILKG